MMRMASASRRSEREAEAAVHAEGWASRGRRIALRNIDLTAPDVRL
ncbi:MAG: hypothetical protein ACYC1E_10525 [Propionibacteriaceae bacterium]